MAASNTSNKSGSLYQIQAMSWAVVVPNTTNGSLAMSVGNERGLEAMSWDVAVSNTSNGSGVGGR